MALTPEDQEREASFQDRPHDVTIDRATLEQLVAALEDSIDCVRHEYETYWGHWLPTRKAQIDSMKESLDRHEASITAGRAALANAEPKKVEKVKKREPTIDLGKYAGTYGGYTTKDTP